MLYEDPKEDSVSIQSSEEGLIFNDCDFHGSRQHLLPHQEPVATSNTLINPAAPTFGLGGGGGSQIVLKMEDGSCGFSAAGGQQQHHFHQQLLPGSDLAQRKDTLQSWQNLEGEIRDLQELIAQFSNIMVGVS